MTWQNIKAAPQGPENRIGFCPANFVPYAYRAVHWLPGEDDPAVKSFPSSVLSLSSGLDALLHLCPTTAAKPVQQHMDTLREILRLQGPSRAVVPVICGSGLSAQAEDARSNEDLASSFYCAVSGNFHHSPPVIEQSSACARMLWSPAERAFG